MEGGVINVIVKINIETIHLKYLFIAKNNSLFD